MLGAFNITLGSVQDAGKVIKDIINEGNPYRIKTVVIDPGHGGHDPGCSGSHSKEKHLALNIGLRLRHLLEQNYPDIEVIMTREKDVFIPLHKRAALANRNQADLFISIHCNYMPGSKATRGTETFVLGLHRAEENLKVAKRENASILLEEDYEKNYDYDPNSPEGHIMLTMFQSAHLEQSILFAELAEQQMKIQAGRRSRGVKQAGFVVLRETTMPSVLVETGFLSNLNEQNFLKTEGGQMKIAKALLKAFSDYKQQVESPEYLEFSRPATEVASLPQSQDMMVEKGGTKATLPPSLDRSPVPIKTGSQRNTSPPSEKTTKTKPTFSNVYRPKNAVPSSGSVTTGVQFFVQLAASSKPQNTASGKWTNLAYPVEVVKEGDLYKYRARNLANLSEAQAAKKDLRTKGFEDAFVVAYKNGQRISMKEALETVK